MLLSLVGKENKFMAFNDSLSDMLARIKNAHKANKTFTSCYKSKLKYECIVSV